MEYILRTERTLESSMHLRPCNLLGRRFIIWYKVCMYVEKKKKARPRSTAFIIRPAGGDHGVIGRHAYHVRKKNARSSFLDVSYYNITYMY